MTTQYPTQRDSINAAADSSGAGNESVAGYSPSVNPQSMLRASPHEVATPQVDIENPGTPGTGAETRLSASRRNARVAALSGALAATGYGSAGLGAVDLADSQQHQRHDGHQEGDDQVTSRVRNALVNTDDLRALDIEVATDEGVVNLDGIVDHPRQADTAAAVARNQVGARAVRNRLRVRTNGAQASPPAGPALSTPADPAPTDTSAPPPGP